MTTTRGADDGDGSGSRVEFGPQEEVLVERRPALMSWPFVIVFGWLVLPVVYSWWRRRRTRYVITTDRVIIERTRPFKENTEVPYGEIVEVRAKNRLIELGSQTRTIQLETRSGAVVELEAVFDYSEVVDVIREQLESD